RDRALGSVEPRLENEGVWAIAPGDAKRLARRDLPMTVLACAKQGGKTRIGIEARPAQPVDRAIARDQRRRLAIANQAVVFDAGWHGGLQSKSRRVRPHALTLKGLPVSVQKVPQPRRAPNCATLGRARLPPRSEGDVMNEDALNTSVRRFLKKVGITSQR